MGGLVSRTYIQSLARDPQVVADTPSGQSPPTLSYRAGDIDALVMLSTPNRGAKTQTLWEVFKHPGDVFSVPIAAQQVENKDPEHLLDRLNENYVSGEDAIRHLFLQGDDAKSVFYGSSCGDPSTLNPISTIMFIGSAGYLADKNDGAVEASKAVVALGALAPQRDHRRCVPKSHTTITRLKASDWAYADVVRPFVKGDPIGNEAKDENCLSSFDRTLRVVVKGAQLVSQIRGLAGPARTLTGNLASSGDSSSGIGGAFVTLSPTGPDSLGMLAAQTNGAGELLIPYLAPGNYNVAVRAKGFRGRAVPIEVDSSGDLTGEIVSLERDFAFLGPTSPSLTVEDGASVIGGSVVTLHPKATDATEMLIGEDPTLSTSAWQPYAESTQFLHSGGAGIGVVFGTFRNASGLTSDTVAVVMFVSPDSIGGVTVTSTPDSADVWIGGQATGRRTPTTIDSLPLGDRTISVVRSGYAAPSGPRVVSVTGGGITAVNFDLLASHAPSPPFVAASTGSYVRWAFPLLQWNRASDPDPGDFLSYRVTLARDSLFAVVIEDVFGTDDTTYVAQNEIPDSTEFWWRVQALDSHGLSSGFSAPVGPVRIDVTPPSVAAVLPQEGWSAMMGQAYDLPWSSSDWSGVDSVTAFLSRDNGATYTETIFHGQPSNATFRWTVTGPLSSTCRMRFVAYDRGGNTAGVERGPFRISTATGVDETENVPKVFALFQNRPNPFNPATTIRFDSPLNAHMSLMVFDATGKIARILVDEVKPAGRYSVLWDGRGNAGEPLSSGIYFARFSANTYRSTQKMVLLK